MSGRSPAARCPPGSVATTLPCTRSTTETVPLMPLVTYATRSVGWTATQRGSSPTRDFGHLVGDVIAIRVFHSNDRDTVRLAIDDDETRLVGGQSDGGRARWCPPITVLDLVFGFIFALFLCAAAPMTHQGKSKATMSTISEAGREPTMLSTQWQ